MIRLGSRAVVAYLVVMLLLAAAAGAHERLDTRRAELLGTKATLAASLGDLRAEANAVRGPRAVRRWAETRGMVPAPENATTVAVIPHAPPVHSPEPTGLEVRTVWR